MTTRHTPTFLLKGLDPNKLLADYLAGIYQRQPKEKSKIKITQNNEILAPTYGTTNYAPIFSVKDKNNCSIIIATTGHKNFEVFTRTGGSLPVGGRCDFCKQDFIHEAIGYPIGYQELTVLTNDDVDPKNARYRVLHIFWTDKDFCCCECALGHLQLIMTQPSEYRDTTLRDSDRLLRLLHKLMYPNAGILRPSQDPKLLRENGGSLTKEQWSDSRYIYVRTDRVLMIPAKVEYIRQNFSAPGTTIDYARDATTAIALSS